MCVHVKLVHEVWMCAQMIIQIFEVRLFAEFTFVILGLLPLGLEQVGGGEWG